jgi:hypothetical protein
MNAALKRLMNTRSPRVVAMGRKPCRVVVGLLSSKIVKLIKSAATLMKNRAVGPVQAIQLMTHAS